jgi:predicted nucleotidyltransferase
MRLKDDQRVFIRNRVKKILPDADIYLFGSRTKDESKGGDIDILVVGKKKLSPQHIRDIKIDFYKQFGQQKIDIVSFSKNEPSTFRDLVLTEAIKLCV